MYSGVLKFTDAHGAIVTAERDKLTASGKLDNGLVYETQVVVLQSGGRRTLLGTGVRYESMRIDNADSLTILVFAGTNYLPDRARKWRGDGPDVQITRDVAALVGSGGYDEIRNTHLNEFKPLFSRVLLNLGTTPAEVAELPTDERLARYAKGAPDPELEVLFFQYGRYLLLSSSRPGSLPANLQGLWNNSNDPPWRSDYHSNINIEMNYWPAEVANLAECARPFFDYVASLRGVRAEATHDYYLNVVDPKKVARKPVCG
jgi:alpha-L-fucosidase 2